MANTPTEVLITAKEDLDLAISTMETSTDRCILRIDEADANLSTKVNEANAILSNSENNIAIIDNKINSVDTKINSFYDDIGNLNYVSKDNINRKFKPLLGQYVYIMNGKDSNGRRTISHDTTKIDKKIATLKESGVDYIEICIHIGFNSDTKQLFYETNLDTIEYIINKCESVGLPILLLKIHEEYTMANVKYEFVEGDKTTNLYDVDKQTQSIAEFKRQMEIMYTDIFTLIQGHIPYLSVMNEWEFMWNRGSETYSPPLQDADESGETQVDNTIYVADFPTWLVGIINQAKGLGFKVGVSTAGLGMTGGFSSFFSVSEQVYSECDIAFLNMYPPVSAKGTLTTYEDCKLGWDNYFIHNVLTYIYKHYPNIKQVIISETGNTGHYANLFATGNTTLQDEDGAKEEVVRMYMKAMLESLIKYTRDDLYGVTWWYTNSFLDEENDYATRPNMIEFINYYLGKGV